jgi:hypothetical protein
MSPERVNTAELDPIVTRLKRQFPSVPDWVLWQLTSEERDRFGYTRVRDFVPRLVERQVAKALGTSRPAAI